MRSSSVRLFCVFVLPGKRPAATGPRGNLVPFFSTPPQIKQMPVCAACGAGLRADESFCGKCGARRPLDDSAGVSRSGSANAPGDASGIVSNYSNNLADNGSTWTEQEASSAPAAPSRGTGEIAESDDFSSKTSRTDDVPDKRPKPKALAGGKVLNARYEIVRRIGGGGMGAVYLAKDRNLGEAARAVKEMIESHIDDTQHEKAIGDFKRESLLLTSLEHPSIPTIYDYFYDESLSRFYLVMKYISGGDLASRMRAAPGGKLDEKTVTEWGIQVADVLHYLHTRPESIIYRDLKPANP